MTTQSQNDSPQGTVSDQRNRWMAGIALIGIGLLVLVGQFVTSQGFALLFVPLLGLIFLIWGAVTRTVGLLIPGGILIGIGLGIFLIEVTFSQQQDPAKGGVFMLSFALGWALITVASWLFTANTHRWPLIPGGIFALLAVLTMSGGNRLELLAPVMEFVGRIWPLGLIVAGLYVMLQARAKSKKDHNS